MNLNLFIAKRLGAAESAGKRKLSGTSNRIAAGSVAVSILVMIVSMAISRGFRSEIVETVTGFTGHFTLSAPGVDWTEGQYPVREHPELVRAIAGLPFVKAVRPVSYRAGIIKAQEQIQGAVFKGVDSTYDLAFFSRCLSEGEVPVYTGGISNDVLIPRRLSETLGCAADDRMTVYFIDPDGQVRVRRFRIAGIYDARLEEADRGLIVADARQVARLNGWENGEVSGYEIVLNRYRRRNAERQKEVLSELIYDYTAEDDEDSITVESLQDRYYVLFDWLHLLDMNVLIILALMTAVAGFNMVSGLLILLFERIPHIGVLKALGMRDRDITGIFLYRASFIVLKGLAAGNGLAGLFCWIEWKYRLIALDPANYFVKHVPIDIDLWTVLEVNAAAFAVIMIILLIPCHFISRISPARTVSVR